MVWQPGIGNVGKDHVDKGHFQSTLGYSADKQPKASLMKCRFGIHRAY